MPQKKPDWIASRILQNVTPIDIESRGERLAQYTVNADPETYWKSPKVQEQFQNNHNQFLDYYNKELDIFKANLEAERLELNSPGVQHPLQYGGSLQAPETPIPFVTKINPDIEGRDFNWSRMGKMGPATKAWREEASKIVHTLDDRWVSWDEFKKEKGGAEALAKFAMTPEGQVMRTEKNAGNGYLQELGDGEALSMQDQVYSPNAKWWGFYGNEYGAKQFIGNIVNIAPNFLTGIAEDSYTIANLFTDEGSDTNKFLNQRIQNTRYWDWGMTTEGQQDMFGFEGITNLVLQGMAQLVGMKGAGLIGKGVAKSVGVGVNAASKIGSISGRGLMSMMIGAEAANISRAYNLSKDEAAIMTLMTMAVTYPLMGLSEYAISGSLGRAHNLVKMKEQLAALGGAFEGGWTPKMLKTAAGRKYSQMVMRNHLYNFDSNRVTAFLSSAGAESIEEGAEEAVKTSLFSMHDFLVNHNVGLDRLSMGSLESNHNTFFGDNFESFDWSQEWNKVGQAAAAGGIAGGFAGGIMKALSKQAPQTYNHMFEAVLRGGKARHDVFSYIEALHQQGRLGQNFIDPGSTEDTKTINDTAYENIKQVLDNFATVVDQHKLGEVFQNTNTDLQKFLGVDLTRFLGDANIDHLAANTSLTKDVKRLVKEIEAVRSAGRDTEEANNELERLETQLSDILSGKKAKHYQQQLAMFIAQSRFENDYDIKSQYYPEGVSPEMARSGMWLRPDEMMTLNNHIQQDYDYFKTKIAKERDELAEASNAAKLGEPLPIITPAKQKELQAEAKKNIRATFEKVAADEENPISEIFKDFTKEEGSKAKTPTGLKPKQFKEFLSMLKEGPQEGQTKALVEAMDQLQQVNEADTKTIPDYSLADTYFRVVNKSPDTDGELTFSVDTQSKDLRELIAEEEQELIKRALPDGSTTYTGNESQLHLIYNNAMARIDQLTRNEAVQQMLGDKVKLDPSLTDPTVLKPVLDELESIARRVSKLIQIREHNMNNPDAIKDTLTSEAMLNSLNLLDRIAVNSAPIREVLKNNMNQIGKAIEENDFTAFSRELQIIEDALHRANQGQNFLQGEIDRFLKDKDVATATYLAGLAGMSSSEFVTGYAAIQETALKQPSAEQFAMIKDTVKAGAARFTFGGATTKELPGLTRGGKHVVLVDGAGGTGKTSVVLGYSALTLSERYNKSFDRTERKVLLAAPTNASDKAQLLYESMSENFTSDKFVMTTSDAISILKNKNEIDKYNVMVIDEIGLNSLSDTQGLYDQLQLVNERRSKEGKSPITLITSGDSLQLSSTGLRGQDQLTAFDFPAFRIPSPKRLRFSFRGVNQALTQATDDFSALFDNLQHQFGQYTYDTDGNGIEFDYRQEGEPISDRVVSKARKFLETAAANNESAVVITDGDVPSELSEFEHRTIKDSQGHEWDKVVFLAENTDIRNPSSNREGGRRGYYTAFTRAKKGVYALVTPTNQLFASPGRVYNYDVPQVAPTTAEETERVGTLIEAIDKTALDMPITEPIEIEEEETAETILRDLEAGTLDADPEDKVGDTEADPTDSDIAEQAVLDYLNQEGQEGKFALNVDMTSELDPTRSITRVVLYPEKNEETQQQFERAQFFLTAAVPGVGRFKLPRGRNNADPDTLKRPWFYLEAEIDGVRGTIGALQLGPQGGQFNTPEGIAPLFEGVEIGPDGFSISVPREAINFNTLTKNPLFINPKSSFKAPVNGDVRLGDIADNFPGFSVSRPMIAIGDYFHLNNKGDSPTVANGQAFIAISLYHNSQAELEADMQREAQSGTFANEEYMKIVPLDVEARGKMTNVERDNLMTEVMSEDESLEIKSPIEPKSRLEKLNEMLWNRIHNTSNQGGIGNDSRFTELTEAERVPTIRGLMSIVKDSETYSDKVRYTANLLLPTIAKDWNLTSGDQRFKSYDDVPDEIKADLDQRAYEGRRSLMIRALRLKAARIQAERLGKDASNIPGNNLEIVYTQLVKKLERGRGAYITPEYVIGETTPTYPWAALPKVRTVESASAMGQQYDESLLRDYAFANINNGITHPQASVNTDAVDDKVRAIGTLDNRANQSSNESKPILAPPTSTEFIDTANADAPTKSIRALRSKYYTGPNNSLIAEGINNFRRLISESLYITEKGANPGVNSLDETLKALRQSLTSKSVDKDYPQKDLYKAAPRIRLEYHTWVAGKQFDFLLGYTYPAVKLIDGKYTVQHSYKEHSGIGSKEESALGENTSQQVQSIIYSTPLLDRVEDGYETKTKDKQQKSTISTVYLNMEDTPTIISDIYDAAVSTATSSIPGLSTRARMTQILKEAAESSPHAEAIYRRFFSPTSYTVDGVEHVSFGSVDNDVMAQEITDAITLFLNSNLNKKFYTVNVDDTASLPVSKLGRSSMMEFQALEYMRVLTKKGEIKQFDRKERSFVLANQGFSLKGAPNVTQLTNLYRALGFPMDSNLIEEMAKNKNRNQVLKSLQSEAYNLVAAINDGSPRKPQKIIRDMAKAYSSLEGQAFRNYVLTPKGSKQFTLQKKTPVALFKQHFLASPDHILSQNVFHPETESSMKVVDFITKQGFTNNSNTKISENDRLLREESLMYDLYYGFMKPLNDVSKSRKTSNKPIVLMPFVEYADAGTNLVPAIELQGSPYSKGFIDTVIGDYIKSKQDYLSKLESAIVNRWNATGKTNATTLSEVNAQISNLKTATAKKANLVQHLDYEIVDSKLRIKPDLLQDIRETKTLTVEGVKTRTQPFKRKLRELLETLPANQKSKVLDAAKLLGGLDRTLELYYHVWQTTQFNMKVATTGPNYQYNAKGQTGEAGQTLESIDLVKRAKLLVSPSSGMLFRSNDWKTTEPRVSTKGKPYYTVSLNSNKVNNVEFSDAELREGYKFTEEINIAVIDDHIVKDVQLTTGETRDMEAWDGATFVTPLTRIFEKMSLGQDSGYPITPVMKNVTYSHMGDHIKEIKNAEFELTPEILKNGSTMIRSLFKRSLQLPFSADIKIGAKTFSNAYETLIGLGVKEDLSNLDYSHFDKLAKVLVLSNNQGNIITELVPPSAMKVGVEAVNSLEGEEALTPTRINLRHKGVQLNATKNLANAAQSNKLDVVLSSQIMSILAVNSPANVIGEMRSSQAAISEIVGKMIQSMSLDQIKTRFKNSLADDAKGLLDLKQRLKSMANKQISLGDRQTFNLFYPVFMSEMGIPAIAPKVKGADLVEHPADGIIDVTNFRSTADTKKLKEKGIDPSVLHYSEPKIKGVPITKIPAYQKLETAVAKHNWLQKQTELEPGRTEILIPRTVISEWNLESDIALHKITAKYFENRYAEAELKNKYDLTLTEGRALIAEDSTEKTDETEDTNIDIKEEVLSIFETAKEQGSQIKERFDASLQGLLTRTPGTGPHSTSSIVPVGFIDGSENVVFVPAEVPAVSGSDYDIDKKTLAMYDLEPKSRLVLFPESDPISKLDPEDPKNWDKLLRAHKNNLIRTAISIMENPKNAVSAQLSVDASLDELKTYMPENQLDPEGNPVESREPILHEDLVANWKTHEENYVGKGLISVFANTQKIYSTLYEYKKATDKDVPIDTRGGSFNQVWTKIGALINAGTDTVKNRVLGPLGINAQNADFISYLIMTGKSYEEIFGSKGIMKDKALVNYFSQLRNTSMYFSTDSASKIRKSEMPKKYAKRLQEARVIGQFAQLIPNTKESLPSSLRDTVAFVQNFKNMMNEAGLKNFNLFNYLEATATERALLSRNVEMSINPLDVIENLPHLKGYYMTMKRIHDKHMANIPIYNYLYENTISQPINRFNGIVHRVYQAAVERFFNSQQVTSSTGHDLSDLSGREEFAVYVHEILLERLRSNPALFTNKFVAGLTLEEVMDEDGENAYTRLILSDLKQLSEQKQAEIEGGFQQLDDDTKKDLALYALMSNGMQETRNSIAPLIDATNPVKASWMGFLNKGLTDAFERITPNKLYDLTIENTTRGTSPVAIPFNLGVLSGSVNEDVSNFTIDAQNIAHYYKGAQKKSIPVEIFIADFARRILDKQGTGAVKTVEAIRKLVPKLPNVNTAENIQGIEDLAIVDTTGFDETQMKPHAEELISRLFTGKIPAELVDTDFRSLERFDKLQQNFNPAYTVRFNPIKSSVRRLINRRKNTDTAKEAKKRAEFCNIKPFKINT